MNGLIYYQLSNESTGSHTNEYYVFVGQENIIN